MGRWEIRKKRKLFDNPFGVGLIFHLELAVSCSRQLQHFISTEKGLEENKKTDDWIIRDLNEVKLIGSHVRVNYEVIRFTFSFSLFKWNIAAFLYV